MKKRLRRWGLRVLLLVIAALGLHAARGPILAWTARWLDVSQTPRAADYALALGGDANLRPFVVAALVRSGFATGVLVSRVSEASTGVFPPDHELCQRVYTAAGIAPQQITLVGRDSQSTYDEAVALEQFLATRPAARVIVVTDPYHTRRARWIFGRVLGTRAANLCWVAAPSEMFQAENWWRSLPGITFVPAEYLRFAYYVWRYSPPARWSLLAGGLLLIGLWCRRRFRSRGRPGASPRAA